MAFNNQANEQILGAVHRQAMAVLEVPASEREERYAIIRQSFYEAGKGLGWADAPAAEWASNVEQWVRALVGIIEQGGGGSAGTA